MKRNNIDGVRLASEEITALLSFRKEEESALHTKNSGDFLSKGGR
jgi:hypothetical protein